MRPGYPSNKGEKVMVSLEGTRTNANLKHAFSEEGLFDRRSLNHEMAAEAVGFCEFAELSRAAAGNGACFASGHLELLLADDDCVVSSGMSPSDFAAEMTTMIDDRSAMYAGMARTARDEGFEEIGDWFETLAKAGRSHALRLQHVLRKCASGT
jgi:rubrerythrin